MKLIDNEKILMKNTTGEMTLTNFRLIKSKLKGGVTTYTSTPIDKISSVHFKSHNYKWILYIGIFIICCGFLGAFGSRNEPGPMIFAGCLFGGLFVVAYFMLRIQILEIGTVGGERIQTVTNEKFESAFKFIHAIEHVAKTGTPPSMPDDVEAKPKSA